jgi:hypothetical protein
LVALVIVVAAGAWHGIGTERWRKSEELGPAVARLSDLPERVGDWQARPVDMDAQALRQAGAEGHWLRRFANPRATSSVTIVLLCGRTGQMAVHRPEDCYRGAGYEMAAPATQYQLPPHPTLSPAEGERVGRGGGPDGEPAAFWTACFHKQDAAGPVQLRIYWSWFAGGRWQAPDSPRLAFAGLPVLYKLYVVCEAGEPAGPITNDPCIDLLRSLVPELTKALAATDPPH